MCSIVSMFTVCCMYVSSLWEILFVYACSTTYTKAASARPTPCDALRASVYLRALPMDVRTSMSCVCWLAALYYVYI